MATRAAAVALELRKEDGANGACDEVERFWEEYCVTKKFHDLFPVKPEETRRLRQVPIALMAVVALGVATAAYLGTSS